MSWRVISQEHILDIFAEWILYNKITYQPLIFLVSEGNKLKPWTDHMYSPFGQDASQSEGYKKKDNQSYEGCIFPKPLQNALFFY